MSFTHKLPHLPCTATLRGRCCITPFFSWKKLRLRQMKQLAQSPTAENQVHLQRWDACCKPLSLPATRGRAWLLSWQVVGAFPRCRPLVGGVIESLVHCTYCLSVIEWKVRKILRKSGNWASLLGLNWHKCHYPHIQHCPLKILPCEGQ